MAADPDQLIGPSSTLIERGPALRFQFIQADGAKVSALAIRYQGRIYAYVNACRHIPIELDLQDGEIFDLSGHYLICSMHGARYLPDSGLCVAGPCQGRSLKPIITKEINGMIYYVKPINPADSAT